MDTRIPEPIKEQCLKKGGIEDIRKRLPSDSDIEKIAEGFQAISDPARLKILIILDRQPLCVCLIKEVLDISDSKLSYHLGILKDTGLIEGDRQGTWITYYPTEKGRAASELIESL